MSGPETSSGFREAMASLAATARVATVGSGPARLGRTGAAAVSPSVAAPPLGVLARVAVNALLTWRVWRREAAA